MAAVTKRNDVSVLPLVILKGLPVRIFLKFSIISDCFWIMKNLMKIDLREIPHADIDVLKHFRVYKHPNNI